MSATEEEIPTDLVTVGRYRRPRHANDDTLLILAMGVAYWMVPVEQGFEVRVQPQVAKAVRDALERSKRENRFWPARSQEASASVHPVPVWAFIPPVLLLLVAFAAQQQWGAAVTGAGSLDVQRVHEQGEWWRILTALTLHADAAHLIGNLGMGCFFSLFVLQQFGIRMGWLLILLGGMLGNALNVVIRGDAPFSAIGASTAVFAAVGLLSGNALGFLVFRRDGLRLRELMLPLCVAFGVLGWWGSSGENTDLMGHLFGLAAGWVLGAIAPSIPGLRGDFGLRLAAMASLALVFGAWMLALGIWRP